MLSSALQSDEREEVGETEVEGERDGEREGEREGGEGRTEDYSIVREKQSNTDLPQLHIR